MQCPACAGTFVPQQLPFRVPTAAEGADVEGHGEDQEGEEEGGWHGSFSNLRRDCEPHRAMWIALLANCSLVLGSMAVILCGMPGLLGLPLGVVAWLMGNHDLEQMRQGRMDPRGLLKTQRGRESGIAGVVLSAVSLAFYTLFILAMHPF
jgi:hypothetical protein